MKIYVLGNKGMLGRYVEAYLKTKHDTVIGLSRPEFEVSNVLDNLLSEPPVFKTVEKGDVMINCIGTIKPQVDKLGTLNAINVNSIFPHILAGFCENNGVKLIHISTDCVFSGDDGNYNEKNMHDCVDVYGKTKSLGEPSNCTIVRTSIIGEEIFTSRSLIEWVKSKDNDTINGYLNHNWNGLTCHQTAKVFDNIIQTQNYWEGVRHVHSPNSVNKYELLKMIVKAHELNIQVKPINDTIKCDRTLSTIYDQNKDFDIPDIKTQLVEQFKNPPPLFGLNDVKL